MKLLGAGVLALLLFFLIFNLNTSPQNPTASTPQTPVIETEAEVAIPIDYTNHYFYGESLHLEVGQPIEQYELIAKKTQKVTTFTQHALDQGIELQTLAVGTYTIQVDGQQVVSTTPIEQTWYTITRKKAAKKVTLQTQADVLTLKVERVSSLPSEVYDIVIDPGHGGIDSGTQGYGLYESEEVLQLSLYMKEKLEKKGFKVKITRSTDEDPAGDETFNSERSPYYPNGRIEQIYTSQAKLFISNHLNATESSLANGFQLYSSFLATNTLAQKMSTAMQAIGMEYSLLDDPGAQGEGTFKTTDVCVERIEGEQHCRYPQEDYYFTVRESGGIATSAQKLQLYNENYQTTPNFGAQGI
ncbi:MAG: N-acetylmuramoyl-L-alanine amidase family protein, partial [Culicoidibacterales bacterium]